MVYLLERSRVRRILRIHARAHFPGANGGDARPSASVMKTAVIETLRIAERVHAKRPTCEQSKAYRHEGLLIPSSQQANRHTGVADVRARLHRVLILETEK